MINIKEAIEAEVLKDNDIIESVVLSLYPKLSFPACQNNKCLAWQEAKQYLDKVRRVPHFYIWTQKYIYFIANDYYDDYLNKVPRNPIDCDPSISFRKNLDGDLND